MAKNLQSKLSSTDKVSIFDINGPAMKSLEREMKAAGTGAQVEVAASAFEASKDAVRPGTRFFTLSHYDLDVNVLTA